MTASDTEAVKPDFVAPPTGGAGAFDSILASFGLPTMSELTDALAPPVDPDAVTLEDIAVRLDEIAEQLAPLVELAGVIKANAPKLRKFGLSWSPPATD